MYGTGTKKIVWYKTRFHGFKFLELVPLKNLNLVPMGKFFFQKKFFSQKNMYSTLFQEKFFFDF